MKQTTKSMKEWLKNSSDDVKLLYAINWRIPHTLFNISCRFFDSSDLQKVSWFEIFKEKDLGTWSHGSKVGC